MQKSTKNALTPLAKSPHELIPCRAACPIGLDVAAATLLASADKKIAAQRKLMENNPLPLTLSHLCNAPCSSACERAVSCRSPFVRDFFVAAAPEPANDETPRVRGHLFLDAPETNITTPKRKVAVIGSSPAGLSAAYFLARAGMAPTVFDSKRHTGGWLLDADIARKLSDDTLRKDLARLRTSGVAFALLEDDARDCLIDGYRASGFDAVLLVPEGFDPQRYAALDAETMITERPGVFCAAPEAPQYRSILGDIAQGRRAADALCRYLFDAPLSERLPQGTPPAVENTDGIACAECLEHLAIRSDACSGCLECVEACPSGALYAADSDGMILRRPWPLGTDAPQPRPMIDPHLCAKCGACTRACPQGALEMRVCEKAAPKTSVERKIAAQSIRPVGAEPSIATAV